MASACHGRILALLAAVALASTVQLATARNCTIKVDYDVCIIGAGGSGMFTAVKLKDRGHSVLVVERQNRVGGHCYSWKHPVTGAIVDGGVNFYFNRPIVRDTFARFRVPLVPFRMFPTTFLFNSTGSYMGPAFPSNPFAAATAVAAFRKAAALWIKVFRSRFPFLDDPEELNGGLPDWDTLNPQTARILSQPFKVLLDSLKAQYGKDAFEPMMPLWGFLVHEGVGPLLELPTLHALQFLKPVTIDIFMNNGFSLIAPSGCAAIYNKFHAYVGRQNVKLSATPIRVRRLPDRVRMTYHEAGARKLVTCRRLVVSAMQTGPTMRSLFEDLDQGEKRLFDEVTYNVYHWAMVNATVAALNKSSAAGAGGGRGMGGRQLLQVINPDPTVISVHLTAQDMTTRSFPTTTTCGSFENTPGVMRAATVGLNPGDLNRRTALDLMFKNMTQWAANSKGKVFTVPSDKSQFAASPMIENWYLARPKNPARFGLFYKRLYNLQGHKRTYYTGAMLSMHTQHDVWRFSDALVKKVDWGSC